MPTEPIPIPAAPQIPDSTRDEQTFDAQFEASLRWQKDELTPKINALATVTYDNAVATRNNVSAASDFRDDAERNAEYASDARDAAQGYAAAAGAAAGLPVLAGKAGCSLRVKGDESSAAWVPGVNSLNGETGDVQLKTVGGVSILGAGDVPFKNSYGPGECYVGLIPPDEGVWIEAGALYLRAAYPELAAALPEYPLEPFAWSPIVVGNMPPEFTGDAFPFYESESTFADGKIYALGYKGNLFELDKNGGVTHLGALVSSVGNSWVNIKYGAGLLVANDSSGYVMVSSDKGRTWSPGAALPAPQKANGGWLWMAYDGQRFVALDGGIATSKSAYSTDPRVGWTSVAMPSADTWNGLATDGAGTCVAICNSNGVSTTKSARLNGAAWTAKSIQSGIWHSVTYGKELGLFIAVAENVGISTSPNGDVWTARSSSLGRRVASSGKLAVTMPVSGTTQINQSSNDGITWINRSSATIEGTYTVTAGDGLIVVISNKVMLIDSYGYDRRTHFFVPKQASVAGNFRQWVRAA